MAAAALVCPDRLDKPSLMLAGQPEEEVSEQNRLTPAVDEMECMSGLSRLALDYENCIMSTAV